VQENYTKESRIDKRKDEEKGKGEREGREGGRNYVRSRRQSYGSQI
jgi:hypothetical protein